jgi:hypothetical protein
MSKKKILLLQYKWPLQIHGLNLVGLLKDNDYEVVYLVIDCESRYIDKTQYDFFKFIDEPKRSLTDRFVNKFIKKGLNKNVVNLLIHEISKEKYDMCISIEKFAFVYLASAVKSICIRHIHYSLELYYQNPGWFDKDLFNTVLRKEKYYHSINSIDFIIQSSSRLKSYERYLGVKISKSFFLPVINKPPEFEVIDRKWSKVKIISYIGNIERNRFVEELSNLSNLLNISWTLLLHGPIFDLELKTTLGKKTSSNKLILSHELLGPSELDELFRNSDIGVCFYSNENDNDKYIAYSSEKITRYLSHGVPVVLNLNSESADFISKYNCGWVLDDLNQLPDLINSLTDVEYQMKSVGAKKTFDLLFNYNIYSEDLKTFLIE